MVCTIQDVSFYHGVVQPVTPPDQKLKKGIHHHHLQRGVGTCKPALVAFRRRYASTAVIIFPSSGAHPSRRPGRESGDLPPARDPIGKDADTTYSGDARPFAPVPLPHLPADDVGLVPPDPTSGTTIPPSPRLPVPPSLRPSSSSPPPPSHCSTILDRNRATRTSIQPSLSPDCPPPPRRQPPAASRQPPAASRRNFRPPSPPSVRTTS